MSLMSLWKAPQNELQAALILKHGVRLEYIDNPKMADHSEYGLIFFALLKSDARYFANCFGAGIIEFRIESQNYAKLRKDQRFLRGFDGDEVGIYYSALDAFNTATIERKYHL